jgi:hypothetical protein
MKTKIGLFLAGLFLLSQSAMAQTTFTVSATVPLATSITMTVNSINSTGSAVFTPVSGTALSFDPMTFNSTNGIYVPNHYYSIDIATASGAGTPDTTVTYTEGANPNGATNGLGFKATATFAKEVYTGASTPPTETITSLGKIRFTDLNGTHEPFSAIAPGWLRIYLGVWTGETTTAPIDPANGQPFTNADAAGAYSGTLTITSTIN